MDWYTLYINCVSLPSQFIPNCYKLFRDNSDETAIQALVEFFQRLENTIKLHKEKLGMQFIGGSTNPGAVDYLIWPWIERALPLKTVSPGKLQLYLSCVYPQLRFRLVIIV